MPNPFMQGFLKPSEISAAQRTQIATAARRQPVATIAALKALTPSAGDAVEVGGYAALNDGGGGPFFYDAASAVADNGGTVIAPNAGGGRWIRAHDGIVSVKWFNTLSNFIAFAAARTSTRAYFPDGTYVWPDATVWPMGLFVFGDPPSSSGSTASSFGTRITSTGPIVSGTGNNVMTGAERVAFLNGFTVKKAQTVFRGCLFLGDSLLLDATGASPYYAVIDSCIMRADTGKTCLTAIGAANALSVVNSQIQIPPKGRGMDLPNTMEGVRIQVGIDLVESGNPTATWIKSIARIGGKGYSIDMHYVENRRCPAYTDGAPIVFLDTARRCSVRYGVSGNVYSRAFGTLSLSTCQGYNPSGRMRTVSTIVMQNDMPKNISLVSGAGDVFLPPVMQATDDPIKIHCAATGAVNIVPAQYATAVAISAGGSGYAVGDVIVVSGGTSQNNQTAAAVVTTIDGNGAITGADLVNTGWYTVAPSFPAATTCPGGSGTAATVTLTMRTDTFSSGASLSIDPTETLELHPYLSMTAPYWHVAWLAGS